MSFWRKLFGSSSPRVEAPRVLPSSELLAQLERMQKGEPRARAEADEPMSKAAAEREGLALWERRGRNFFAQLQSVSSSLSQLALRMPTFLDKAHINLADGRPFDAHYYVYRGVPFAFHVMNPEAELWRRDYRWYFPQPRLVLVGEIASELDPRVAATLDLDDIDPGETPSHAVVQMLQRKYGKAFVKLLEQVDFHPYRSISPKTTFGVEFELDELPALNSAYSNLRTFLGGHVSGFTAMNTDPVPELKRWITSDINAFIELAKFERTMMSSGDGLEFAEGISGMKRRSRRK